MSLAALLFKKRVLISTYIGVRPYPGLLVTEFLLISMKIILINVFCSEALVQRFSDAFGHHGAP